MAIVKGLEEGAVLAKYTLVARQPLRDPNDRWRYVMDENRRIVYGDVTNYYLVKLYSRRNRTNGCRITEDLYPFFHKLKIKLLPHRTVNRGRYSTVYTAVGCDVRQVTEEEYMAAEVDEVAEKHFKKIKNAELLQLMDPNDEPELVIEGLKSVLEEQEGTEAEALELEEGETSPTEPYFRGYHYPTTIWT